MIIYVSQEEEREKMNKDTYILEIIAKAREWLSGKVEHYPYSVDSGFTLPDSVDGYMVIGNIHENQELIGEEENVRS